MQDGVLRFECPKCHDVLEVGLHITARVLYGSDLTWWPVGVSPSTVNYSHPVEFIAEAPHLHAEFWGHLVRCHQPDLHPYLCADAVETELL